MTTIYTIGFRKKTARTFFESLKEHEITLVLDIRLHNTSQLAGFAKKGNIEYLLKEICGIRYLHYLTLAPSERLLKGFQKGDISWEEYRKEYISLLREGEKRGEIDQGLFRENKAVLLCTEEGPEYCHRQLAADYLSKKWGDIEVVHIL